jgi:hypothetical protein
LWVRNGGGGVSDNRQAVLVGCNNYLSDVLPDLTCARNDVEAMSEVLGDPERGGFDVLPLGAEATRDDVAAAVKQALDALARDDLFLLYYSGHAIRDSGGRLYLALRDTDPSQPHTALRLDELVVLVDESAATQVVLVLDCCFSGSIDSSFHELRSRKNVWIITSSTEDQSSYEKEGSQNSILTGFLLDGLREGFADTDGSGEISVFEAYAYAERLVPAAFQEQPQPPQQPVIYVPTGSRGSVVLSRNPHGRPVAPSEVRLELVPTYVAAVGMAQLIREPGPYLFEVLLLRNPVYVIEGINYTATVLSVAQDRTPNLVVSAEAFECDAFFPPDMLAPTETERQTVAGVARVRLTVPLAGISSILAVRTDDTDSGEGLPAVEVLSRPDRGLR